MGKVKETLQEKQQKCGCVSIPYGKGKEKKMKKSNTKFFRYQSPMGKVKNNILCCILSIHHKYRFVN